MFWNFVPDFQSTNLSRLFSKFSSSYSSGGDISSSTAKAMSDDLHEGQSQNSSPEQKMDKDFYYTCKEIFLIRRRKFDPCSKFVKTHKWDVHLCSHMEQMS